MVWLDGKPTLTKTLAWPEDDPDLERKGWKRQNWSVRDDQILFWRAFTSSENPRTVVYMANTTSARDTQADPIIVERVAELDYAAHRLVIVPDVGFVSAEWQSVNSGVHFRAHSRTGELVRECLCPAQASYGDLSVFGPTVSLCVTSTDPIPPNWKNVYSTIVFCRLDFAEIEYPPKSLAAETIATWNADSGDLRMVKIPQPYLGRIMHSADFQYISPDKIVLASSLESTPCGAVLCGFSTNAEDEESLRFYQGQHTDPDAIKNNLGQPSTSTSSPIIVHEHDGNRITIFKSELLSGDIPSFATTRDPPGLREAFNYPIDARTLNFSVSCFPSVAATRVLVHRKDDDRRTTNFVLDFDQTLLALLLSKQPSERADWNAQLVDGCAQVKVVTRRFHCGLDDDVTDEEYPWPQQAPPEWEAHLDTIFKKEMDNNNGSSDLGVEYDEAPEEHREPVPFGYVQTTLHLEGVTEATYLTITQHAILELRSPPRNGHVFYFD